MVWFIQMFSEFQEQKKHLAWKIFSINLGIYNQQKEVSQNVSRFDLF